MTRKPDILILVPASMLPRVHQAVARFGLSCEAASSLNDAIHRLAHRPRIVIGTLDGDGLELLKTAQRYCSEAEVIGIEREINDIE